MPPVLVTVPTAMQNLLHSLSTSSIIACHLPDFMVHRKITEAGALIIRRMPPHPDYQCPHLRHQSIFMPNALSAATLPIYFGLRQASNNAGLLYGLVPKMFENNFIKPGTQQRCQSIFN